MLRTRVATCADWADQLREEWTRLVADSNVTPFQTWEWQSSWWRSFGRAKRPRVFTVWEGGDLVGLMPMTLSYGPWRVLRSMGVGVSDCLQPLCRRGRESQVAAELADALTSSREADLLDLAQIPDGHPLLRHADPNALFEQATTLAIDLPSSFEAFTGRLGNGLRRDLRRPCAGIRIERVGPEGMETLFTLHARRWRARGLPGSFASSSRRRFHREWSERAARNGWLRLYVLHVNDEPAAALYAMGLGQTCYYYQAGFDPAHGARSPGTLLLGRAIEDAIGDGLASFDLMRGDETYKRRWRPQRVSHHYGWLAHSAGWLGSAAGAWSRATRLAESRLKERWEGRALF